MPWVWCCLLAPRCAAAVEERWLPGHTGEDAPAHSQGRERGVVPSPAEKGADGSPDVAALHPVPYSVPIAQGHCWQW